MKTLLDRLQRLLPGGAGALSALRKRLTEHRPSADDARLEALENAMELQATLNESVDVRLNLIHQFLEKTQKKLQIMIIALIATATVAALALAAAWLR